MGKMNLYRGGRSGGSLHDPRGTLTISYAQGLGHLSNNSVEEYALKEENTKTLPFFGDSMIIIKTMIGKST